MTARSPIVNRRAQDWRARYIHAAEQPRGLHMDRAVDVYSNAKQPHWTHPSVTVYTGSCQMSCSPPAWCCFPYRGLQAGHLRKLSTTARGACIISQLSIYVKSSEKVEVLQRLDKT